MLFLNIYYQVRHKDWNTKISRDLSQTNLQACQRNPEWHNPKGSLDKSELENLVELMIGPGQEDGDRTSFLQSCCLC
jgi:hypothetical protein